MKKSKEYEKAIAIISKAGEAKKRGMITASECVYLMTEAVKEYDIAAARADYTINHTEDIEKLYRRMALEIKRCM